jgi:hypothetical protein
VVTLFAGACTDLDSATNLNPDGPPMIRQVRLKEVSTDALGNPVTRRVFAFGTHTLAATTDYPALGANSMTTAGVTGQSFRVVMDELLVGNYMEEIACRGPVDSDAYDFVPLGTTPDHIAKCSVAKDVLPGSCPGSDEHSVCICKIAGGCGDVPEGGPVGVLDVNQDGAADDTRFIDGAVGIKCGTINVPIDVNNSYWNPSGDQNRPAMGGFDALGPAIVLAPTAALPTNLECSLEFAPNIVDKQNNRVCAPPGGDVEATCTPGDVSAFKFKTEPLRLNNQSFLDGDVGVDRAAPVIIVATAPLAMGTLTAVTVTQNGTALPTSAYTVTLPLPTSIRITWTAPLAATTTYVINVATTLTDTFNQPLVMPVTYTFTTGS